MEALREELTGAPAVASIANPRIMYMGGNNNAASSGVLKTVSKTLGVDFVIKPRASEV